MLRLVIDTEALSLEDDPRVVYLGHSMQKAQEAIDASKSSKLSITEVPWLRRAKKSPVIVEAPVSPTAPELSPEELLEQLTIEELKEVGGQEGIDLTGCELKKDFVDRIADHRRRKTAPLDDFTIEGLKHISDIEGVDVTGCKLKKDFVEAISAHRSAIATPPESAD